jgi:hypothetical protein
VVQHVQPQLDVLVHQQQILEEVATTSRRMLETAEALVRAVHQGRSPISREDRGGESSKLLTGEGVPRNV